MEDRLAAIRRVYYDYLDDGTKLDALEAFVYANEWIRDIIGEYDYLELISINFRARDVRYQLGEILIKHVGWAEHQKELLMSDLEAILRGSEKTPQLLASLYDRYCQGYYFLNDLGLGYGLSCECPTVDGKTYDSWDDISPEQQRRVLRSFQPQLGSDVRRALEWLKTGSIVLVSKRDELQHVEFEDNRTPEEKKSTVWSVVHQSEDGSSAVSRSNIVIEKKPWWKKILGN